jgi:hypothetical protein
MQFFRIVVKVHQWTMYSAMFRFVHSLLPSVDGHLYFKSVTEKEMKPLESKIFKLRRKCYSCSYTLNIKVTFSNKILKRRRLFV